MENSLQNSWEAFPANQISPNTGGYIITTGPTTGHCGCQSGCQGIRPLANTARQNSPVVYTPAAEYSVTQDYYPNTGIWNRADESAFTAAWPGQVMAGSGEATGYWSDLRAQAATGIGQTTTFMETAPAGRATEATTPITTLPAPIPVYPCPECPACPVCPPCEIYPEPLPEPLPDPMPMPEVPVICRPVTCSCTSAGDGATLSCVCCESDQGTSGIMPFATATASGATDTAAAPGATARTATITRATQATVTTPATALPTGYTVQNYAEEALPIALTDPVYTAGYLMSHLGSILRAEFLMGDRLVERVGILIEVGATYIVLEALDHTSVMYCDLDSMRFATIVPTAAAL